MADLYSGRKRRNVIWTVLAYGATALGLCMLAIILATLVWNGFGGLSLDVFTKMTAPPGVAGGLLNSIVGSFLVTAIGLALGAPIGILAGTYLAEYGANSRLASVVRFINDILLSAPSIVVGNATKIQSSILAQGTTISAMIANQFADADPGLFTSSLLALGFILFVITFVVLAAARWMLARMELKA